MNRSRPPSANHKSRASPLHTSHPRSTPTTTATAATVTPTTTVILLKAPSDPKNPTLDPYYEAFAQHNIQTIFVPVLEHGRVNEIELLKNVKLGPGNRYGGVIVSSTKAVEAWGFAASKAVGSEDDRGRTKVKEVVSTKDVFMTADWSQTPFYSVGPSTAKALTEVSQSLPPLSRFSPTLVLGADESGTGEKLAQFILSDYSRRWTSWYSDAWKQKNPTEPVSLTDDSGTGRVKLPLLYLTGDKTTETMPQLLEKGGIGLTRLQVYSTWAMKNFGDVFARATLELRESLLTHPPSTTSVWVVFFAPSAAKSALPTLSKYFSLPSPLQDNIAPTETSSPTALLPPVRFAAIGPTTAAYLHRKHTNAFSVDAVPAQPDPAALVEAILRAK